MEGIILEKVEIDKLNFFPNEILMDQSEFILAASCSGEIDSSCYIRIEGGG